MSEQTLPPAIFLMGPTASGKTALAVAIAQAFNCEIISVDSALVYRGMDIGTAKPSVSERGGIVHHLIDILDPSEAYSTAQFRQSALAIMGDIIERGKTPLLTGGTMLYFNALLNGLVALPTADPKLRRELDQEAEQIGWQAMHGRLQHIDPVAAARIHPNDPQRIQRALEVYALTGKSLSRHLQEGEQESLPYRTVEIIIAPEQRSLLHEKIALRFNLMLQQGLLEEVEGLYRRGDLSVDLPAIRAVGYRQVWMHLQGIYDYQTMIEKAVVATRQLAKRQFTWLRKMTEARWYDSEAVDLEEQIVNDLSDSWHIY